MSSEQEFKYRNHVRNHVLRRRGESFLMEKEQNNSLHKTIKTKQRKKGRGPVIVIQILAVLMVIIGVYLAVISWNGYAQTAAGYNLAMGDVLSAVIPGVMSAGCPYLGFASILYGISLVLDHQIENSGK